MATYMHLKRERTPQVPQCLAAFRRIDHPFVVLDLVQQRKLPQNERAI